MIVCFWPVAWKVLQLQSGLRILEITFVASRVDSGSSRLCRLPLFVEATWR